MKLRKNVRKQSYHPSCLIHRQSSTRTFLRARTQGGTLPFHWSSHIFIRIPFLNQSVRPIDSQSQLVHYPETYSVTSIYAKHSPSRTCANRYAPRTPETQPRDGR